MALYNSFYGGKRGAPFIITKVYQSINDMIQDFKQGPGFNEVEYDEYVMIYTTDLNNWENGDVYRRGYSYENDMGGAEFIGKIQGPIGYSPLIYMDTYDNVYIKGEENEKKIVHHGNVEVLKKDRWDHGEYQMTLGDLLPGKYYNDENDVIGQFNDTIKWVVCSLQDEHSHQTDAWVGFKIPYLVIEQNAKTVSPYYNRTDVQEGRGLTTDFFNDKLIERVDDKQHPFYEQFQLSVPKGIKGDTFKNFRVIQADSSIESYTGQSDDISHGRQILVYDYWVYDRVPEGDKQSLFLGDFNMIDKIQFDEEGTLTIDYTHDDRDVWYKWVKWVKNISLNVNTGLFTIDYNHNPDKNGNPTQYTTYLDWVKNISISEDGTITFDYTHSEDKIMTKLLKWVTNVQLNGRTGHFTMEFNHDTDAEGNPTKFETDLRYLNGINIADDGEVTFSYTTGPDMIQAEKLKWVSKVLFDSGENEGEGTQCIEVHFNNGSKEIISKPINYIMKTVIDKHHLLVLNSDPVKRQLAINEGRSATYDGRDDWEDLGSVKEYSGILIGKNISPTDVPQVATVAGTITYLNTTYPNGLTGEQLEGKVITVDSGDKKIFYAYDYDKNEWYSIGTIDIITNTIVGREDDLTTLGKAEEMPIGGLWFVVKDSNE